MGKYLKLILPVLLIAITICSCRCWYKGGYLVGAWIRFKTTNPVYLYHNVIAVKLQGQTHLDTLYLGSFSGNNSSVSLTIPKEDASMYAYLIIIDSLRRDSISDVVLELKGPACDPEIKRFDFRYNGQDILGDEITLP